MTRVAAAVSADAPSLEPSPFDLMVFDLVVFDVDGTLYDQRKLRRRMAARLLLNALEPDGVRTLRVLRAWRRQREEMAKREVEDFEPLLIHRVAARHGCSRTHVAEIAHRWLEVEPLSHLRACRRPGVATLFARLRSAGKRIAVLSDYPAEAKLEALGLAADIVVSARDKGVGLLKPHPRGLLRVLELAGVAPGAALMVGDRAERDGEAARRAGVQALIIPDRPDAFAGPA